MSVSGFKTVLALPYEAAIEKVTAALKTEGFGVLTSIDVKDTLKQKLDVDFRRYAILGACNPPLAHKALSAHPEMGLLLPCNVIVYEQAEAQTVVNIIDPLTLFDSLAQPDLQPVAAEAAQRLQRVAAALRQA